MGKRKTINIEPFDLNTKKIDHIGKFVLTFIDENKKINIHLERWWIKYLAENLHNIIKAEQEELNDIKKAMKGDL